MATLGPYGVASSFAWQTAPPANRKNPNDEIRMTKQCRSPKDEKHK